MVLVELKISKNLFRNINIKITALAATALHICFSLLASLTLLRGIEVPNCGCFGFFFGPRPLTFITTTEDIFMVGVCVFLFKLLKRNEEHN
jgi:hypothetical protein